MITNGERLQPKNGDLSRDQNVLLVERGDVVKRRKMLKSLEVMLLRIPTVFVN